MTTWTESSGEPIERDEARSRSLHAAFERFYEEREEKRLQEFAREMTERMSAVEDA